MTNNYNNKYYYLVYCVFLINNNYYLLAVGSVVTVKPIAPSFLCTVNLNQLNRLLHNYSYCILYIITSLQL